MRKGGFQSEKQEILTVMQQLYPRNTKILEKVEKVTSITEIERIQVDARKGIYDDI